MGAPFASSFFVKPLAGRARVVMYDVDKDGHDLTYNPMEDYQSVDMKRAQQCAENFGECSVEEMEQLRDSKSNNEEHSSEQIAAEVSQPQSFLDLHRKRQQKFMFGSDNIVASDEAFNQLVIEEELDMQLHLLKQNMPPPTLFPKIEEDIPELPRLKNDWKPDTAKEANEDEDNFFHKAESMIKSAEVKAVEQEAAFDEESLEAAAICLAIAGLIFTPQLFGV